MKYTAALALTFLLTPLAGGAGAGALHAQDPPVQAPAAADDPVRPHPEAEKAISRLRSPYCPGLMLEICPSEPAEILRDSIQMLARQGMGADSLVEWMLANHGEEWRGMPRASGMGLWAWLAPPLFLLLGLAAVVIVLRRLRGGAVGSDVTAAAEAPEVTDVDRERLHAAIQEMEEREEAGL